MNIDRGILYAFVLTLCCSSNGAIQFNITNFVPGAKILTSGSASITEGSLFLTQSYSQQAGLSYYADKVHAHLGFTTSFTWIATLCNGAAEGFSFFLTKDLSLPANLVPGTGLSVQQMPNTYMVGYSLQYNEFYVCNWTNPFSSSFRESCRVFPHSLSPFGCYSSVTFNIQYSGNTITVSANGVSKLVSPLPIEPNDYFMGLSGSTGQGFNTQRITSWIFNEVEAAIVNKFHGFYQHYPFIADFIQFGSAKIASDGRSLLLTSPRDSDGAGAVIYHAPMLVHLGFKTSFVWTPTNCDASSGGDGFSLFLTKRKPDEVEVLRSSGAALGVKFLYSTTMFSYSANNNQFYVCQWDSPSNNDFHTFCSGIFVNTLPKLTCGGSYTFSVAFGGSYVKIFVNGQVVAKQMLEIDAVPYYVGVGGSISRGYFDQKINDWSFYASSPVASQFSIGFANESFYTLGSAGLIGNSLRLTTSGNNGGIAIYSKMVWAGLGFSTTFFWNATNCGGDSTFGGDGFAIFLTKHMPLLSQVDGGGSLGIKRLHDISAVAYNIYFNEFYVCNWEKPNTNGPLREVCLSIPNPNNRYTCDSLHEFTVKYDGAGVKMLYGNSELFTAPFTRNEQHRRLYYVGFGAGTGSVYMQLNIESWSFNGGTRDPEYSCWLCC